MIDKRTAGSYNHSHKKSVKSLAKVLDIKHRIGQNSQLHSFTASQPRNLAAEGLLCPNKTPKHTQIFSTNNTHKSEFPSLCVFYITPFNKPQGTQSVELRSTSQRIIKECLTKPLLKHLASLACSAVKLKNIRRTRC